MNCSVAFGLPHLWVLQTQRLKGSHFGCLCKKTLQAHEISFHPKTFWLHLRCSAGEGGVSSVVPVTLVVKKHKCSLKQMVQINPSNRFLVSATCHCVCNLDLGL